MVSNSNRIYYACISKGTTILAEFTSDEPGIEALAMQCIEKTPPLHSIFSHTFRKRTYSFLIEDPFVYFAIYDMNLDKIDAYEFLNRLKSAVLELTRIGADEEFTSYCFQSHFNPVFREIAGLGGSESLEQGTAGVDLEETSTPSLARVPFLGTKPSKSSVKKKRRMFGDVKDVVSMENSNNKNKVMVGVNGNANNGVVCRDFSPSLTTHKSASLMATTDQQKAKQVWKKHVWVVLILDLLVCAFLLGIWLWVCRGFKCIDA